MKIHILQVMCARWDEEQYKAIRCGPEEFQRRWGVYGIDKIWRCALRKLEGNLSFLLLVEVQLILTRTAHDDMSQTWLRAFARTCCQGCRP